MLAASPPRLNLSGTGENPHQGYYVRTSEPRDFSLFPCTCPWRRKEEKNRGNLTLTCKRRTHLNLLLSFSSLPLFQVLDSGARFLFPLLLRQEDEILDFCNSNFWGRRLLLLEAAVLGDASLSPCRNLSSVAAAADEGRGGKKLLPPGRRGSQSVGESGGGKERAVHGGGALLPFSSRHGNGGRSVLSEATG